MAQSPIAWAETEFPKRAAASKTQTGGDASVAKIGAIKSGTKSDASSESPWKTSLSTLSF